MRREVEGDKDRLQRGTSLLPPLPDQVVDCHGSPKTTRSSGRFAYLGRSVGEWAVLRACERLVYQTGSGMCHSQPPGLPYAAKPPLPQDAKDHAGRAGLDREADAKWSLSEDHVSAQE
jgi:hypothetical protein